MVFFTCNHCGESLKKPAVDKHYQWKSCKGATPFLTCVDCLKDFRSEEFRDHTKCVSELERYSAKGFVAKPDKNKGAQKQEIWIDVIQNLQLKPGLDGSIRSALERIGANSNVPRKKAKFLNYIKSSMRMSPNNADKLWNVIEVGLSDYQKIIDDKKSEKEAQKRKASDEKTSIEENHTTADDQPAKKKKKDKKSKNKLESDTAEPPVNGTAEVLTNGKSKKRKTSESIVTNDDRKLELLNGKSAEPTNKKSKKSEKNDISLATNGLTDGTPKENGSNSANANAKKKKSKKNKKGNSTAVSTMNPSTVAASVGSSGFDWKAQILKIVTKKSEINMEKLKTKVLKKFAAKMNVEEITHKNDKTFKKHLKKLKSIAVDDSGTVKMVQ